ncbi:hypothetical protein ACH6CV_07665 [Bacillota bacterium Meth-B3]
MMKILLWPKATAGRWAAGLTLTFIVCMALKFADPAVPIRFPLPTPFIAGLGVIGFVMGVISAIKNKDRALLTWLSILIGLLVIIWVAAEIAFPH